MLIPVGGGSLKRRDQVCHLFKATALQCQRTQGLPPGFNEIEPGGIGGLKEQAHLRVCQEPETNIQCLMNREIVQDDKEFTLRPLLHSVIKQIQKLLRVALGGGGGDDLPGGRFACAKDPDIAPSPIVSVLMGAAVQGDQRRP